MNGYDCETVRDLLPALLRDELAAADAAATSAHLDACADCRADAEIVRMLHATLAPLPAGLEAKIVHAVRHEPDRSPVLSIARWPRARMAMAATVAAVAITGSIVFQQIRSGSANEEVLTAMSWAAIEMPLLQGSSELDEMTAEDLEILLTELDP